MSEARNAGVIGDSFDPDFLLSVVMMLPTMATAASPFGPHTPAPGKARDALRRQVVASVSLLSRAVRG